MLAHGGACLEIRSGIGSPEYYPGQIICSQQFPLGRLSRTSFCAIMFGFVTTTSAVTFYLKDSIDEKRYPSGLQRN